MNTDLNKVVVVDAEADMFAASEIETRVVNVECYCGHKQDVVVDDTAEAVEWALEYYQSENCNRCDAAYEAAHDAHIEAKYKEVDS